MASPALLLYSLATQHQPIIPVRRCHLENHPYPSLWNKTTLRVCTGPPRPERVCIVGGGPAGIHLAWLLKRRLYTNVTVFEANDRVGGDVWTHRPSSSRGDNITRELGAAFLSPDYFEVRSLLARFGQTDLPLSKNTQLEFNVARGDSSESVLSSTEWATQRLSHYTNSTNITHNAEQVQAALERYIRLHRFIFVWSAADTTPPPLPSIERSPHAHTPH